MHRDVSAVPVVCRGAGSPFKCVVKKFDSRHGTDKIMIYFYHIFSQILPFNIFSFFKKHINESMWGAENDGRAGDGKLKIDCKGPKS